MNCFSRRPAVDIYERQSMSMARFLGLIQYASIRGGCWEKCSTRISSRKY
jgi:hypothetical protein